MGMQGEVKEKMRERGVTQEEVGRRLGITKQNVNGRLNNGCQQLRAVLRIAEAAGLTCRVCGEDGEEMPGSQNIIEAALKGMMRTEQFENLAEAMGGTVSLDWRQQGDPVYIVDPTE